MLFLAVAVCALVSSASAHGWMRDPVPRSGGGAGSGNASTRGPCGRAGPSTPVAEVQQGKTLSVGYSRVNGHGPSGDTVELRMVMNNENPTAADFAAAANTPYHLTAAGRGTMRTDTTALQTTDVEIPTGETGLGVIQFEWNALDGSRWYDCAYVTVAAPAVTLCDTANPCAANAKCTPVGAADATCECGVGYFPDPDARSSCPALPADTNAILWLEGEGADKLQNNITDALAKFTEAGADRVLYDRYEDGASYFAITAHPGDGHEGAVELQVLREAVSEQSPALEQYFGPMKLKVTAVQVIGLDAEPVMLGDPLPSSINAGIIAVVVLVAVAAFGGFAFFFLRWKNNPNTA